MFDLYEAEELILSMAYVVSEKRRLEEENEELKNRLKDYHDDLNNRYNQSQENTVAILKAALFGVTE